MSRDKIDPNDSLALQTLSPLNQGKIQKIETVEGLMEWLSDKLSENDKVNRAQHRKLQIHDNILIGYTREDGANIPGVSEKVRALETEVAELKKTEERRKWIISSLLFATPFIGYFGNIILKIILLKMGIKL